MKTRRVIAWGVGVILAVIAVRSAYRHFHSQPSYQGRTVRQWVDQYVRQAHPGDDEEALEALNTMKEAAVPYLVILIQREPGVVSLTWRRAIQWLPQAWQSRLASNSDLDRAAMRFYLLTQLRPPAQLLLPFVKPFLKPPHGSRDYRQYYRAIDMLGTVGTGSEQTVPFLCQAGASSNADIRALAVHLLGQLGRQAQDAEPLLVQALKDPQTRLRAIQALGHIGPAAQATQPALEPYLTSRDDREQLEAAAAVFKLNPEAGTLDRLLAAAVSTNNSARQNHAIWLLQDLEPPALPAVELLLRYLMDLEADSYYHSLGYERTLRAIRRLDPTNREAIPVLLARLQRARGHEQVSAAATLVRVYPEEPQGVAALAAIVRDSTNPNRIFAADELGKAGPAAKAAIPALKAVTHGLDPYVRRAALRALKAIEGRGPK